MFHYDNLIMHEVPNWKIFELPVNRAGSMKWALVTNPQVKGADFNTRTSFIATKILPNGFKNLTNAYTISTTKCLYDLYDQVKI